MLIANILKQRLSQEGGHECATASPSDSVETAVAILAERGIGAVVVTENAGVAGIFSERDLVKLLARDRHGALDRELRGVMTTPVVTCKPDDTVDHVLAIMSQRRIRHAPVVGADGLAGMVSIRDLVRSRLSEKELEAAVLLDISRFHG